MSFLIPRLRPKAEQRATILEHEHGFAHRALRLSPHMQSRRRGAS
jgi:hypothetical protein